MLLLLSFLHFPSTFFSRSKLATTVGTVLFLAMFFPYYAVSGAAKPYGSKVFASIMPSVAFALCLDVLATLEGNGVGVNAVTSSQMYDDYKFGTGECVCRCVCVCV